MDKQTALAKLAGLQPNYSANQDVLEQLSHINLIAVVGPTGAGKSTIVHQAGLPFVVGDTTRAPREGEVQGREYNFRTDFNNLCAEIERGEFVQFVIQRGSEVYGTKASSYPSSGVCTMPIISSSLTAFKSLGFASVQPVYIVPPNHSEWMRRISAHRDRDLESRLLEAKESLQAALADQSYVFILNDNLDTAVGTLRTIASGKVDTTESARARASAGVLYEHLQKVIK